MIYRDVGTLQLAFGWVRRFTESNGIHAIPEWWAFIVETCGLLSWVVMFLFGISLFVGYSRQLSSFYLLYEHVTGAKLSNPYKPAFLFFLLWCSLYVIACGVTITGVYFLKYGYIWGAFAAICSIMALAGVGFIAFKTVYEKPKMPPFNPHMHPNPNMHMRPDELLLWHQQQAAALQHQAGAQNLAPPPQYIAHQTQNNALQVSPQHNNGASEQVFNEALSLMGLERGFTKAQLKARYRDLSKKFHSDKGGTNGLYLKIKSCYEYLLPYAK